ncbi:hypothetical protein R9X49_01660 [Pectobacterium carotovorum]|uniref:hypothetical protein n=1 Tax=Pectobacterium carotovorum TaxID=554 RepID=UPI0029D755A3|nr:hypothetical protein [Pectobacterium carotovorum]MDX6913816.1 hypothetical protein [Pectobacterium carotovorum]
MQAQPKTKHEELLNTLLSYIDSNTLLDESLASDIQRDIRALPETSRSYLTAWLMVALGKHDDAVEWFKDAMVTSGENASIVAGNYVGYLSCSAHNLFHREEVFRLSEIYFTQRIRKMARNAAFCIGSERLVKRYTVMLKALLDGDEREKIEREGAEMVNTILEFKQATKLTTSEIQHLCDAAEKIANDNGINCVGVEYFLTGGYDNALILFAATKDADTLTTLNLELISLLADDAYIDRPFTSWFKSSEQEGLEL